MQHFTPVPLRARHDGWTPARQQALVAALAETGSVAAACRRVGKTRRAAYRLRARPDAASLAAAWDAALAAASAGRRAHAVGRAVDGIATPIRYRGRQVGERRRFDNRLAMFLLRIRRPERYGAHAGPTGWDDLLDEHAADHAPFSPAPYPEEWILPAVADRRCDPEARHTSSPLRRRPRPVRHARRAGAGRFNSAGSGFRAARWPTSPPAPA